MIYTIKYTVDWVIKNRKGYAFKDYDEARIASAILRGIKTGVFHYSLNDEGMLNGIVVGDRIDLKTVIIHDILTLDKGVVKYFMKVFLRRFGSETRIIGKVGSRDRVFNDPVKLYGLLH